MKISTLILGVAVAGVMASCYMNDELTRPNLSNQVIGIYEGTQSSALLPNQVSATAEISMINEYTVQIRCYSEAIDTTFSLELYENGSMMQVCSTDDDFKMRYGYNMSANHHMMGNNGNRTSWAQHMSSQHKYGDEHYGYFDMAAGTFDYTFDFMTGPWSGNKLHFSGKRKN